MKEKKYYQNARRFDESDLCQSSAYSACVKELLDLERTMERLYGHNICFFLAAYKDVFSDLMEFESLHYFEEGFYAGQTYPEA